MGKSRKIVYSIAVAVSMNSIFSMAQQQASNDQDGRFEEGGLNDMRRGLSREEERRNEEIEETSPVRRIGRNPGPVTNETPTDPAVRSIDGSGNNLQMSDMNSTGTPLRRWLSADYADGISALVSTNIPGPREVSNAVAAQLEAIPNSLGATDFFWQWGQFLDHDIDLTDLDVYKLALKYGVSEQAMTLRLVNLIIIEP